VQVLGKGKKARIVPVGRAAAQALRLCLKERAALAKERRRRCSSAARAGRLGPRRLQVRVAYWRGRQGLGVHVHPHCSGHSSASAPAGVQWRVRGVQELLGHADISTTQIYQPSDFQHLARIYDATTRGRAERPEARSRA